MKKAFITLLSTKDYLDAVLVLKRSMEEVHTEYPLVCGITEDIFTPDIVQPLSQMGIIVERISRLQYSEETRKKWGDRRVLNTASKISLFSLTQYDKLCYIDADTFLLQNIDNLLDRLDGSMIEPSPNEEEEDYGFTGLFIFQPRYHKREFYIHLLENFPCADGDLLGNLWFFTRTSPSHRIPYAYCMHYTYAKDYRLFPKENGRPEAQEIPKVIHFCNEEKPWLEPEKFPKKDPIIVKYFKYLEQVKE